MSRTKDNSLDYFPLDVTFFSDRRIRRLQARFGSDGPMFLIYIFCRCYGGNGYYLDANNDFYEDAAIDIGCSVEKIGLMLNYLFDRSLLDSKSFNTVKVLTSHGIQAQYQKSKKGCKRDVVVDETLWVLDSEETEGFIKTRKDIINCEKKSDNSEKYNDKSEKYTQSKVKESKEKETKDISADKPQTHRFIPPTVEEVRAYCQQRKNRVDPERFVAFYKSKGWMIGKSKMKDWKSAVITWEKGDRRGDSSTSMGQAQDSGRWGKLQSRQLD